MNDAAFKIEPDFAEPYNAWKAAPSPLTTGPLLRAVNPVLDTAIKSYGGKSTSPNLRSQAKQLAIKAFDSYDPRRGTLKTHLLSQLQSLRRANAEEQQIISVPEAVRLDNYNLMQAEAELADRLGRSPSDAEISDYTGLSPKRLEYVRQLRVPVSEGMADNDGNAPTVHGLNDDPEAAWREFIYYDLSPTDQLIMDMTLGLRGNDRLPPKEIAQRLGVTVGAISQRTAKIQQLLDSRTDVGSIL